MKTHDRSNARPSSNRAPAAHGSEQSAAQRAWSGTRDPIDADGWETAQRLKIQQLFGSAVQRQAAGGSAGGVVQRATYEDLVREALTRSMVPWGGVSKTDWVQWIWHCWKDEMAPWTPKQLSAMLDDITPGMTPTAKPAAKPATKPAAASAPVKQDPVFEPKLPVEETESDEEFPALPSTKKEPKGATAPKTNEELAQDLLASFNFKSGPSVSSSSPPVDRYAGLSPKLTKLVKRIEAWDTNSMDGCSAQLSSTEQSTLQAWVESIQTQGGKQKYVVNIGPGTGKYDTENQFKVSGFGNVGGKAPTYHITLT